MRAAVWTDYGKIEVQEVPVPEPRDREVLLQVMSAGVCMTDLHVYTGRFAYGKPPAILGHEIAGRVCRTGGRVTRWKEGDRAVVETSVGCGHCRFCRTGQRHLCAEMTEIGFPPHGGGYAQYVAVPEENLVPIPEGVGYDEAGIVESVVCPIGALYRLGVGFADTVAVFGTGPAGIAFIQGAKAMGAGKVIAAARNGDRLRRAGSFGADVLLSGRSPPERSLSETGGVGADLTIDAAGAVSTIDAAVCADTYRIL